MIVVDIALATICFAGQCYPALVGPKTPKGEFQVQHVPVNIRGYGGDVLMFKYYPKTYTVDAIHRVWTGNPQEKRLERLQSNDVGARQSITNGCINVMPEVYEQLLDCCKNSTLVVK